MKPRCSASSTARTAPSSSKVLRGRRSYADGDIRATTGEGKRRRRLASFLEYEYHVKDIAFKELKREFIEKFVVYLSSVQGLSLIHIANDDQFFSA